MGAMLHRLSEGKKFPKRPEELWGEKARSGELDEQALVKIAQGLERAEQREARRKKSGKDRVIHRPE